MRIIEIEQLKKVLQALPENPRIVVSGNFAPPMTLLGILDSVLPTYRLHMLNAQPGIPDREGVTHETAFVGAGMRKSSRLDYVPSRLSLLPVLLRDHLRPDVVLLHTTTPRFDTVSLGIEVNILPAAIAAVRAYGGVVIAQANPQMPYTYGDSQIYDSEIDFLVEVDEPLKVHTPGELSDTSRQIGERIAALVEDNSTLQLGIGAVPDAVLELMKKRKGLRVWTEMFSDGVLDLHKLGALDDDVPITASFIFGSPELYQWLHLNRRVRMFRTEKTNDPSLIARQAKMTSINAALQVDLFDQANASRVRGKIYSGFGGSTDFIVGALHSRGGQSFMALPSWHTKTNTSTIIPKITEAVTSFQHSYVVTENGVAPCFGHSEFEQAANIIQYAAHPDAREGLWDAAIKMGLAL
ncbi:MAG: acetyl-CoA hydrolase/transferase C-terminal domain-containing protein [Actinomycetes bacterium]